MRLSPPTAWELWRRTSSTSPWMRSATKTAGVGAAGRTEAAAAWNGSTSRADGRLAANWADSDETKKATGRLSPSLENWITAASPRDQLQVLLQGSGECLIDDVQVLNAQGVNQIANSTFEANTGGWTAEGTEDQSGWESAEGFNSAHCYHIRAVDRGDNEVNRVRLPWYPCYPSTAPQRFKRKSAG